MSLVFRVTHVPCTPICHESGNHSYLHLVHLVLFLYPARTNTSSSLDKQGLPSGPDRTRGVVEHSKLQSKKSNPIARRQVGVRKEDAPSPPNHRDDEFLTCPRQVASSG